jgi:hypothetical protein
MCEDKAIMMAWATVFVMAMIGLLFVSAFVLTGLETFSDYQEHRYNKKRKRTTEQMAALEELFDVHEDDEPDYYIRQIIHPEEWVNMNGDDFEYIAFRSKRLRRKPYLKYKAHDSLRLSDYEEYHWDDIGKQAHHIKPISVEGDDNPVTDFVFVRDPRSYRMQHWVDEWGKECLDERPDDGQEGKE